MQTIAQIRQNEKVETENRKRAIHTLIKKFCKHRGWKKSFLGKNPMFNNDIGLTMISNGYSGRVSNQHFLEALETFDESVQNERPEWYKITQ